MKPTRNIPPNKIPHEVSMSLNDAEMWALDWLLANTWDEAIASHMNIPNYSHRESGLFVINIEKDANRWLYFLAEVAGDERRREGMKSLAVLLRGAYREATGREHPDTR